MTELEKMMAFHAMQEIKETPDWMQDFNLVTICKLDKTGKFEQFARLLAKHKMPTNEIVPCVMELFQGILLDIDTDDKKGVADNVLGQGD